MPDRVKPSFVIFDFRAPERQSARMSKITNDGMLYGCCCTHMETVGVNPGGPGLPPTGASHQPLNFLANDRFLPTVILIQNFEINEKLCTFAVSFHSLVITFALDDLAFNSTPSSVEIRLRMH